MRGVVARTHTHTHTYTTSSLILTVWQAILISPAMACWIYPCTDMKRYFGVWKVVWRRNDVVTICVLLLRCIDDVMSPALYANPLPRSSTIAHTATFLPLYLYNLSRERKSTVSFFSGMNGHEPPTVISSWVGDGRGDGRSSGGGFLRNTRLRCRYTGKWRLPILALLLSEYDRILPPRLCDCPPRFW